MATKHQISIKKMKHFIYILSGIILFAACAGNNREKIYRTPAPAPMPEKQVERLEARIMPASDTISPKTGEDEITAQDFELISQQKLQDFFDMIGAANSAKNIQNYKAYLTRHAKKLWFNPEKALKLWQQSDFKTADSIKIVQNRLLHFEEINSSASIGTYRITLKIYDKNKEKKITKTAKIYYEIIDLPIDDQVYKTIKARILAIE